MRGHRRLRQFLKAYRSGANLQVSADLAEMTMREAELHEEQEKLGHYGDIVVKLELRGSNSEPGDVVLRGIVERVQRLTEEKKGIQEDIKAVFQEAKSQGLNEKAIKNIIKLMELDPDKRAEHDEIMSLYREALGIE